MVTKGREGFMYVNMMGSDGADYFRDRGADGQCTLPLQIFVWERMRKEGWHTLPCPSQFMTHGVTPSIKHWPTNYCWAN